MHIAEIRLATGERERLGKAKNLQEVWRLYLGWLRRQAKAQGQPVEGPAELGVFQMYDLAPEHEVERVTNGQRLVWSNGYTDGWNWHLRYS